MPQRAVFERREMSWLRELEDSIKNKERRMEEAEEAERLAEERVPKEKKGVEEGGKSNSPQKMGRVELRRSCRRCKRFVMARIQNDP